MGSLNFFLKTLHLLFVIAWLSCVFVLPRFVLASRNLRSTKNELTGIKPICAVAHKIYRFAWYMLFALIACGALLASQLHADVETLPIKLVFVPMLILYYFATGSMLRRAKHDLSLPLNLMVCLFNESSLLLVVPILYLAISKYQFGA